MGAGTEDGVRRSSTASCYPSSEVGRASRSDLRDRRSNVRIGTTRHRAPGSDREGPYVGRDCRIANGAVLGTVSEDLKYEGETSYLEVG